LGWPVQFEMARHNPLAFKHLRIFLANIGTSLVTGFEGH
jgi:hypothetical protein